MTNYLSLVDAGRFEELFEELGWGFVPRGVQPVTVDFEGGRSLTAHPVADQSGLRVWVVKSAKLPVPTEQRLVDAAVNKVSQVRLIIFTDGKNQSWRWPRRGATAATNTKLLHHHYEVGNEEQGMDLARRLQTIELPIGEKIGILEIQERMAKAFNDEAVKRSHEASGHMRVMNEQLLDAGCTTDASSSLLVRLLFLFFGDDTNMWPDDTFQKWVLHHTTAENIHEKLTELFEVLCDPELDKALDRKGRYGDSEYKDFRRIDGMYKERVELPPLTEDFRQQVLKACDFDWGKVNPDIFGAMFQQLVDLEELRKNGEHYTSEENIMKVIEPLFLDEYRARFEHVYNDRKKLLALQDELATLKFLDPACGCGNFLIQAYKHLRGLEYEIIVRAEELEVAEINAELDEKAGQRDSERKRNLRQRLQEIESGGFINFGEDVLRKSKLSMRQFYGIEINDWPAKVAATAMLLVDHLCNQAWGQSVVRLPIEATPEIRCQSALDVCWESVISDSTSRLLIMGNPPFLGAKRMSKEQKHDVVKLFNGVRLANSLDYVAAWFYKASETMNKRGNSSAAFVSTSSICQGQQVFPIWQTLRDRFGIERDFAYPSFLWATESTRAASVYVVIVGFSVGGHTTPRIFENNQVRYVANINAYLTEGPDTIVSATAAPISPEAPKCMYGSLINDSGEYVFNEEQLHNFLINQPAAQKFVRPLVGSQELIKGLKRFVLYLRDITEEDKKNFPLITERIERVRENRSRSTAKPTRESAKTPERFYFDSTQANRFLAIPRTSSERRPYVPMQIFDPHWVATDAVAIVPDITLCGFGILSSSAHNIWLRYVGGRLKSDYRYSPKTVYNTFPWPKLTGELEDRITAAASTVLELRTSYSGKRLAELYDPVKMPENLFEAHRKLDSEVLRAYGFDSFATENQIMSKLLGEYERITT